MKSKKDFYTNQLNKIVFAFADIEFLENEIFKEIEGTEGQYFVSNKGRVVSLFNKKYRILKTYIKDNNYEDIQIKGIHYYIHRLVYSIFNPNEDISNKEIHHIDFNTLNNELYNLCPLSKKDHDKIHKIEDQFIDNLLKGFIPFV